MLSFGQYLTEETNKNRKSDAIVVFGISGDLAYKQIFPALQALFQNKEFDGKIIGFAKESLSEDQLKKRAMESIKEHSKLNKNAFEQMMSSMTYVSGDLESIDSFKKLKTALGESKRPLLYLAIPPALFETTIKNLKASGCSDGARIVVEKPFGEDLKSANHLNKTIHSVFDESNVFRIDHFLGKERVQDLLKFRFENSNLDDNWNSDNIEEIQISMIEDFGIKGRGEFYDPTGCVKDVFQNHLMQLVAFIAMEPYGKLKNLRKSKVNLFRSIKPLSKKDVVYGQFEGYQKEKGVKKNSTTETYAEIKMEINNPRWENVPVWVRSGKMLNMTSTEIAVRFKNVPKMKLPKNAKLKDNILRIQLEGPEKALTYEKLFGYAMQGDSTFFSHEDEVKEQWRVFDKIVKSKINIVKYKGGVERPEIKDFGPENGWIETLEPTK